jgi:hypothetical protein
MLKIYKEPYIKVVEDMVKSVNKMIKELKESKY